MGHYSTLYIGKQHRSWKYDIPAFLSFLFDEQEKYKKYSGRGEDKYLEKIGYKTTCRKALKRLDGLGFGWDMVVHVYESFREDLWNSYIDYLDEHISESNPEITAKKAEKLQKKFLTPFGGLSRLEEVKDFATFYLPLLEAEISGETTRVLSVNGKSYTIKGSGRPNAFPELESTIYGNRWTLPPWIVMIGDMFDWERMAEFNEVFSVLDVKFLLESHSGATHVNLDLADIVDDEAELQLFHEGSSLRLIKKLELYNKFFFSLSQKEKTVKEVFFRQQIDKYISLVADRFTSNDVKGRTLEQLMDIVFSSVEGLKVIERRVNTGDEEIDILLKNNLAKPFWTAFGSPFIFVECKNWSSKAGSSQIRDFEAKLLNHSNVTKIGIFVSYNGFTSEATTHIKRMSRATQHLVFVTGKDLRKLVDRGTDVLEWLEELFAVLH
jgi:hypothetical protein